MTVLAIDPGSEQSAWVLWDGERVLGHGKEPNHTICRGLSRASWPSADALILEAVASYGMPVGAEVFHTVFWTGRFFEAALILTKRLAYRREVKLHICGQITAKDSNIRTAIIDRFGGKETAIGRKASPGPLYGIKADCWQALALALTWHDLHGTPAADVAQEG